MNRRNFIKVAPSGALLLGAAPSISHAAAESRPPVPDSLGMLYDSTLCVGCQACITRCQDINSPARNPEGEQAWSSNNKLSSYTNNIIQVWRGETGINKGQGESGYAYIKKQCIHCVDPNCVSICPVSALKKNPKISIVHYDKDVYVGCRCCTVACPYNVPKYDYDNPLSVLHKHELRNQKGVERLDKGGSPGCTEVRPASAVIFGTREELVAEVKKHLALKLGSEYHCPRQTVKTGDIYLHTVPKYYLHPYSEKEGDGARAMVLTGVPYEDLGLSKLDGPSTGARSEHIQYSLYKGMILPLATLAGLTVLVRHNTKSDHHDGGDDYGS